MKICMIVACFQEFGGMEDQVINLAIALQQQGHQVSVASFLRISPDNQYVCFLRDQGIPFVQLPYWMARFASDWPTKEKMVSRLMQLMAPLVYLVGALAFLIKRKSLKQAVNSTRGWLHAQLMNRLIGRDLRESYGLLLLSWWRWWWRPDVWHLHGYTSSLIPVLDWAWAKRTPVVYEEHQTPIPEFDWWNDLSKSINKATFVVAVSEKSAQGLREVCNVRRPIGVCTHIVMDPVKSGLTEILVQNSQRKVFNLTTVARLDTYKGLEYLLEAIAQVKAVFPSTELKVYGEGPLRQELVAQAGRLGLVGNNIFVGSFTRPELPRIMAKTDIFVLSSILEGQPVALVEAMAYGRAIVATSVGGIPEIIKDEVSGLLCPPRNPDRLAQQILMLIKDPDKRACLGYEARKSYERGIFHPESVCNCFLSYYNEALRLHLLSR